MFVNFRNKSVVESCRAETVQRGIEHLFIEYIASDFSGCFANSVPVNHMRHVALIAWDHCGLPTGRYLFSIKNE